MTFKTTIMAAAAALAFTGATMIAATPSEAGAKDQYRQFERSKTIPHGRNHRRQMRLGRFEQRLDRRDNFRGRRHSNGWQGRNLRRVTASAKIRGFGRRHILKQRARRMAIANWREKVANRYGNRFSRWYAASGKDVTCRNRRRAVRCDVTARPARAGRRFGWFWN